ncbi:MAG: hypothetical protein JOY99_06780 [Sphingomonadaceae bacterium]|nr:hypothetical protein [Sphingomonadaceae bacterium]
MSHIPSKAMPHARAAEMGNDEKPRTIGSRAWIFGGIAATAGFAAIRGLWPFIAGERRAKKPKQRAKRKAK